MADRRHMPRIPVVGTELPFVGKLAAVEVSFIGCSVSAYAYGIRCVAMWLSTKLGMVEYGVEAEVSFDLAVYCNFRCGVHAVESGVSPSTSAYGFFDYCRKHT
jgi:hypothetical protein